MYLFFERVQFLQRFSASWPKHPVQIVVWIAEGIRGVRSSQQAQQIFGVLRRSGRDAAPLSETLPNLRAVCRRLFLLQEQVKFVHEIPGGPSNGAVHRDGVPHRVLDNEHPRLFQILAEALDIEADKAVSDIHGGAVVEEVERAVYIESSAWATRSASGMPCAMSASSRSPSTGINSGSLHGA